MSSNLTATTPARPLHFPDLRPQLQSRFLTLPLDVRYLIYEAVIANSRVDLERCDTHRSGRPTSPIFPYALAHVKPGIATGWLNMLLSCRQIYLESLRALYGSTTFVFATLRNLRSFLWTTPADQLALVRRIEVAIQHMDGFSLPYNFLCAKIGNPDEWQDLFTRLHAMRSLEKFDLWMQDERKTLSAIDDRPWQRPRGDEGESADRAWEAALERRHHQFWQGLIASDVPVHAHVNWDAKSEEREKVLVRVMTKQQMYDAYWSVVHA